MTHRASPERILQGCVMHRRSQSDYMRTLLDRVTLEAWGDVIDATVAKAKGGDPQARAFLASYLVGRPKLTAAAPLDVVADAIVGGDALVDKLTGRLTDWQMDDDEKDAIRDAIASELPDHIEPPRP